MAEKYYFSTRDLLLIAILCCLGGVASTYIGYIGSTLGSLTGMPMGGQMLAGLHIFWIVLVLALVDKKGAGAMAGLLKGFVELVSGSHLGILVLPASLLEGIFAEIGFRPLERYRAIAYPLAGGLGAWANILITQTLFNAFPGIELFAGISLLAFASGIVFAGYLGFAVIKALEEGGLIRKEALPVPSKFTPWYGVACVAIAVVMVAVFALHFAPYLQSPADADAPAGKAVMSNNVTFMDECKSMGNKTYNLMDHQSKFITVTAVDPAGGNTVERSYTGLPLVDLVNMGCSGGNPRFVDVIGKDNSIHTFKMTEIRANRSILLVPNGTSLDIVAPGYPADMWVRNADKFRQY